MSDNMSRFLGDEPEDEGAPAPAAVEQPQRDFEPVPEPEPEPEAPAEPEPAPAEPVETPVPAGGRMVPLSALEAERAKRQEFERRLAEFEKPKPAAPAAPQPAAQWINPAEDPAGYHNMMQERFLNERLNTSEMLTRREVGSEKVDAAVAEFQQAAQADPTLMQKLYAQPDPYSWLVKEVDALRLRKEIGDDPASYEARLRAKWEAEMAEKAAAQPDTLSALPLPRMSPAAGLQPSLARARSVAGRVTVDESDQPLGDILRGR